LGLGQEKHIFINSLVYNFSKVIVLNVSELKVKIKECRVEKSQYTKAIKDAMVARKPLVQKIRDYKAQIKALPKEKKAAKASEETEQIE